MENIITYGTDWRVESIAQRGEGKDYYGRTGYPLADGSNFFELNSYDSAGNLLCTTRRSRIGAPQTRYYTAGHVFDGDSLLYSYFPGGYFDAESGVHYNLISI